MNNNEHLTEERKVSPAKEQEQLQTNYVGYMFGFMPFEEARESDSRTCWIAVSEKDSYETLGWYWYKLPQGVKLDSLDKVEI